MIEARGLSIELGAFSLRGIDLEISEGEYFVLLGPTGAGKTVLIECLVGLHTPRSGAIVLDGRDVTPAPPEARGVAYVPQDYCLFPNMTAARNIAFGLRHRGWSESAIRARVSELAGWLGLEPLLSRLPLTLSGGEKQRVALARALAIRPRLLLLDEPLAAVDPRTRDSVCDELKRIQREFGTTTIHVCHDFEEALAVADRLAVMNEGRIIQAGTPEDVFRRPETEFTARFTGAVNVFPCEWGDGRARLGGMRVPAGGAPGGRGWFVCRPEHVEIRPPAPATGPDGFLPGTVIRILDRGPYRRIDIASAGLVFSASLDHRARPGLPLAPGLAVEFGFPAEKIVLIPDPAGARAGEPS